MGFDNRMPAASDDIEDTLNYKAVSKRLVEFVSQSDFGLVETLAERCAEIVLAEFGVQWLRLKLSKPGAVRGAVAVGVIIERCGSEGPALMGKAYLSLGSNVAPEQNLRFRAAAHCAQRFGALRASPVYRTACDRFRRPRFPQCRRAHPFATSTPHALNDWLHALEDAHGRDRSGPRFGDRPLDIDIVFYDDLVIEGTRQPALAAPRAEARLRAEAAGGYRAWLRRSGLGPNAGRAVGAVTGAKRANVGGRAAADALRLALPRKLRGEVTSGSIAWHCPHASRYRHPPWGSRRCSTDFRGAGNWSRPARACCARTRNCCCSR